LFKIFQDQLKLTASFDLDEIEENGLYQVKLKILTSQMQEELHILSLLLNHLPHFAVIEKMFEFSGMLYAHVLKVLIHLKIHYTPLIKICIALFIELGPLNKLHLTTSFNSLPMWEETTSNKINKMLKINMTN